MYKAVVLLRMIQGKKVILRPATLNDRPAIFRWLAQSDITSNMIGPPHFAYNPVPDWDEFATDYNAAFFNDVDPDTGRSFIIEVNGMPAGHINYNEIDRSTDTVELDIWLAGSSYCNKGFGTDAIIHLCRYLAVHLQCRTFILAPSARNKAAIRAYEKCGFTPTSQFPPTFIPDYHDTVIMIKRVDKEMNKDADAALPTSNK